MDKHQREIELSNSKHWTIFISLIIGALALLMVILLEATEGFLLAIVGVIFGFIGKGKKDKKGRQGNGFALIGIGLNIVVMIIFILMVFGMFMLLRQV